MEDIEHKLEHHEARAEVESPRVILGDDAGAVTDAEVAFHTIEIVPNALLARRQLLAGHLRDIVQVFTAGTPPLTVRMRDLFPGVNLGSLLPILDRVEYLRSVGSDRLAFTVATLPLMRTLEGTQGSNMDFELCDKLTWLSNHVSRATNVIAELSASAPELDAMARTWRLRVTDEQRTVIQAASLNWPLVMAISQAVRILFESFHPEKETTDAADGHG